MSIHRVWQVKRGDERLGPFPEPLVCQYILLGRIHADDLLSIDGHFWAPYPDIPELMKGIDRILGAGEAEIADPAWREERRRAVLRHLDERKRPDRRIGQNGQVATHGQRQGQERRKTPESEEQLAYRRIAHEVDQSLRRRIATPPVVAALLMAALLVAGWALYYFQPREPLKVDLRSKVAGNCDALPAKGVDWHGCDKSGHLLVGADLRNADLTDANLAGANLAHARLEGANLSRAVWVDGRVCAEGSLGACK
jgi:hypothetical protein